MDGLRHDPFVVRNIVYGVQDSLFSTSGVVVGTALAGLGRRDIVVTGAILVLVEALSMSFGAFVSEDSFIRTAGGSASTGRVATYAAVMFASYVAAGLIPLLPFLLDLDPAWKYSIAATLVAIFGLMMAVERRPAKASVLTGVGAIILGVSIVVGRAFNV